MLLPAAIEKLAEPIVTLLVFLRLPLLVTTRATIFITPEHAPGPGQRSVTDATAPLTLTPANTASGTGIATALLLAVAAPAPLPAVTEHVIE